MDLISNEEKEIASKNIKKYNFKTFFEKDSHQKWFNSILEIDDRNNMHPIFWLLQEDEKSNNLSNCLSVLKENAIKYNTIIKKLINDDFESFLAEIEVICYFYQNFDPKKIYYGPKIKNIHGETKYSDLKVIYKKKEYFIEISILKDDDFVSNIRKTDAEITLWKTPNVLRIKYKLFEESQQLPKGKYNIIIIKLKDLFARSDLTKKQAIYGERVFNPSKNLFEHKSNGFIHSPESTNVSAFIFYKNNFKMRELFINPFSKNEIDDEIKNKLETK